MQLRRPSFELKVSFDLIIIGDRLPQIIRVGLAEEHQVQGQGDHLQYELESESKKQAAIDKDAVFIDDKKTIAEHLFTSFDLPQHMFMQFRFKDVRLTDLTHIIFELDRGRGIHAVQIWQMLARKTGRSTLGMEVCLVKADMLPINQETLVLVLGNHRAAGIFNPPKPEEERITSSPAERMDKREELLVSGKARADVVKEIVKLSASSKSIPSIVKALGVVSTKYMYFGPNEDITEETIQNQVILWDSIVCSALNVLLLNEPAPTGDQPFVATPAVKAELQTASQTIHPFTIVEITEFMQVDPTILAVLLRPDTMMQWLLLNRLNIQPDLEVVISSASRDQKLDTLRKIRAWNAFDKLVVCQEPRVAINFAVRLLTEYITNENTGKKILGLIDFICRDFRVKRDIYSEIITTNDALREEFFNAVINLMVKITRSAIQNHTVTIAKEAIVEGVLGQTPGLPAQFFRLAFLRRSLQIIPLMRYFFELNAINKEEKIQIFSQILIVGNPASIGVEVSTMVGEMIKNSKYFRPANSHHFTTTDVFREIDSKFKKFNSDSELIEDFVGKSQLSEFQSSCIIAYDQKLLLGYQLEPYLANSNLVATYEILKSFMKSMSSKVRVGHLLKTKCFSPKVVTLFESLNEDDYSPFHLKLLKLKNEAIRLAQTIKKAVNFMEYSEKYLEKYSFRAVNMLSWMKFQEELELLTLKEAMNRVEFQLATILERPHFEHFRLLSSTYPQFMETVQGSLPQDPSLEQFSDAVKDAFKLQFMFISFTESKKFTVGHFDKYFPDYPKEQATYEKVLQAFALSKEQRTKVFQGCQVIYAFKKVVNLTQPLDIVYSSILGNIKSGSILKKMKELKSSIKPGTTISQITVHDIEKMDSNGLIKYPLKQDRFVLELPAIIQNIAAAPELMRFIKENGDKFIKSMREEVDNDNLDIVTKLDVVNKNLKFLFSESELEPAIYKLVAVGEDDLNKVSLYLSELEGQVVTHLNFLANKTKKDAGYSNQLLKQLLSGCEYVFSFEQTSSEYEVKANFEKKLISVSAIELSELLNKTLIIVSDKVQNSSTTGMSKPGDNPQIQDEYSERIVKFSDVGKCLLQIKKLLKKMRDLGIIYNNFNNILRFIEGVKSTNPSSNTLSIVYTEKSGLKSLKLAIDSLTSISSNFDRILRNCYRPDASLMAHFYGKKLYWLMEYLTGGKFEVKTIDDGHGGHNKKEEDRRQLQALIDEENRKLKVRIIEENLNLLYEAHPAEGFVNLNLPGYVNPGQADNLPEVKLKYVHSALQDWTREVVTKREQVYKPKDGLFVSMKVLVANGCQSIFSSILKVLKETSCTNICLSQFLFCTTNTSSNQVVAFTRKALMDKSGKPHFIIHLNKTGYAGVAEFRKVIEALSDEEWQESNPRIIVFNEPDSTLKNLLECELFLDANPLLQRLADIISDDDVRTLFVKNLSKTQVVVSDVSGMGKTTYIKEQASKLPTIDVFIAGDINPQTLMKRMHALSSSIETIGSEFALVIKLDFIEDFGLNFDMIDFLLFCLCLIGRFKTEYGCCYFGDKVKKIFIEVGNTFVKELFSQLSLLQFFSSAKENVHRIPAFSLDQLKVSLEQGSNDLVAYNFMKTMDKGMLASLTPHSVNRQDYITCLKQHLLKRLEEKGEKDNLTYARYQYWLKVISHLWSGLSNFTTTHAKNEPLIKQVSEEILDFSAGVIGLSVKQVRTSQDEMKKIMKEIDKEKVRANNLAVYQETVKGLMHSWSTKEMIVPLVMGGRELFAIANLEMFDEGRKRHGLRNELKRLILSKGWFVNPAELKQGMTEEFLTILSQVTKKPYATILSKSQTFRNTGFSLTPENYMKVCLILIKAELNIPIIMMGESGCGKTYLSHYVAEGLLEEPMYDLTLYSGVTEEQFLEFMRNVVKQAKSTSGRVWVLFDEFNTSSLQSLVAEIMLDRVCSIDRSIYEIPQNVVFIACCNPYRMKTKSTTVGLVSRSSNVILSHRVYPIPERLIDYVWDFGQLSEADEMSILKGIIKSEKIFDSSANQTEDNYVSTIYDSHKFVRDLEERSGVSLRDIKRVLVMYKWFLQSLVNISKMLPNAKDLLEDQRAKSWALVSALMVCYGLRLNGREEQQKFLEDLTFRVNSTFSIKKQRKAEIHDILPKISDFFLTELKKEGTAILGEGTAINRPLKENFITMLAAFDTVTPMIICGAPGTSKTLSTHILNSAMVPYIMKKYSLFGMFSRGINPIYYGGSETSTSEGISHVFRRGEKYLEQEGEDRPVVVFDEIGLAELSPYNPLKVLHPLLEKKDMKVGFIGLSNWTLDLSKMNRLIFISRPDMELNDLVDIFESSLAIGNEKDLQTSLKKYLFTLAKAYLSFRDWQKRFGSHPNFHGSRDIYSVAKFFYNALQNIKQSKDLRGGTSQEQTFNLIKTGIERNFSGTNYEFSTERVAGGPLAVPITTVDGMIDENRFGFEQTQDISKAQRLEDLYSVKAGGSGELVLSRNTSSSTYPGLMFSSSQVFKKFFLNKFSSDPECEILRQKDFMRNAPIFELICSSTLDPTSRFMLVQSEGEIVENILIENIRTILKEEKIVDWRGVSKKESNLELFSNIKSYISLGYFVIMKNLDELYGSLYDLFNQKFTEVDGRKYCYLYFGESKHRVEVHPKFNCIILVNADNHQSSAEIEVAQPAPFLNRFEKYYLKVSDVFPGRQLEELILVRGLAQSLARGMTNHILALNTDMISSICISCQQHKETNATQTIFEDERMNSFQRHTRLIFRLSTMNYLLRDYLTADEISLLKSEHPHTSLRGLLQEMKVQSSKKTCLFTFSNPIEFDSVRETVEGEFELGVIKSDELFDSSLETRARLLRNYPKNFLIIQFIFHEHLTLISQIKSILSENSKITKVLFLVHLDRHPSHREILKQSIGINYWAEWDNRVLDNLKHTDYAKAIEIREATLEDLILNDTSAMMRGVLQEIVVECFTRLAQEKNETSIKANLQHIRRSIERDTEDLFITILKERLRDLQVLDSKSKWMSLLSREHLSDKHYVDFEKEIFELFMSKYGDKTKKIVARLNIGVKGYAGYSTGLICKDKKVAALFKEKLKDNMENCKISNAELNQRKNAIEIYIGVPFLAEIYGEYEGEISSQIFSSNESTLTSLADMHHKLTVLQMKGVDSDETKSLSELISKGEDFLLQKCSAILTPLIAKINIAAGDCANSQTFLELVEEDMLSKILSLPRLQLKQSLRNTQLLLKYCKLVNRKCRGPNRGDVLPHTITTAVYLLGTSLADIRLVTEMITSATVHSDKINNLIEDLMNQPSPSKTRFDLAKISELLVLTQASFVPNLLTTSTTELRLILESTIDSIHKQNSLRVKEALERNFRALSILLGLIENLSMTQKTIQIEELENIRKNKEAYGKQLDFEVVGVSIEKLLLADPPLEWVNLDRVSLLLTEYVKLQASAFNFTFFLSKDFDYVIKKLTNRRTMEGACSIVAKGLSEIFPAFWQLKNFESTYTKLQSAQETKRVDSMLSGFNTVEDKNMYVIAHIVDYLYLRALSDIEKQGITIDDKLSLELVTIVKTLSRSVTECYQYQGIALTIILRLALNRNFVERLKTNEEPRKELDSLLLNIVNTKDDYFVSQHTFILTYFLQKAFIAFGDIETMAAQMRVSKIILGIINSSGDTDLMVTSLDASLNEHSVKVSELLYSEISKQDNDGVSRLFSNTLNGCNVANLYSIGLSLINRFMVSAEDDQASGMSGVRSNYIDCISRAKITPAIKSVYEAIIANKFSDVDLLLSVNSTNTPSQKLVLKLKKCILHFLLVAACFPGLGYSFNRAKVLTSQGINNEGLMTPIAVSENLANYMTVFMNIVSERVAAHATLNNGEAGLGGMNLGIYQCSCQLIYSIGQCGYAMEKRSCPRCGLEIGGGNHQSVQRAGHKHVTTLGEFVQIITKEFDAQKKVYKAHPPFTSNSSELWLATLMDMKLVKFFEFRNKLDCDEMKNKMNCLFVSHLLDHLYMFIFKQVLPQEQRNAFSTQLESSLKLTDQSVKDSIGRAKGREIRDADVYYANHISNDLEEITRRLNSTNIGDAIDFVNTVISRAAIYSFGKTEPYKLKDEFVDKPRESLKLLNELKNKQLSSQDTVNTLMRTIIQKNIDIRGVTVLVQRENNMLKDRRTIIGNEYPIMRHAPLDRRQILESFKEKLALSQFSFLKSIVNYEKILIDFPKIVGVNLDLTLYLNQNYNRTFTFDETTRTQLEELKDPQLNELFKEFALYWKTVIPKHEDTHPEVFSFAFMCNQDLNVAKFIDGVLSPNGANLVNFLLVDSSEEFAGKETLYMKGIVRTLLDGFHNKLVNQAKKVLKAEDVLSKTKLPMEYVTKEDLVTFVDYEAIIFDNMWANPDVTIENEVNFNFERIEYLVAKQFLKKEINCEENCLKFYHFKNSRVSESEQLLRSLSNKVTAIPLGRVHSIAIEEANEQEIEASLKFILEMGEYISQNFLFTSDLLIRDILLANKKSSLNKRFGQYSPAKHGELMVGQIPQYYELLKERNFTIQLGHQKKSYSKAISSKTIDKLQEELRELPVEKLNSLKEAIREQLRTGFYVRNFNEFVINEMIDIEEAAGTNLEGMTGVTFASYFPLTELIDEIMSSIKKN